jgi:phosphate-selective porin OprO/OprP
MKRLKFFALAPLLVLLSSYASHAQRSASRAPDAPRRGIGLKVEEVDEGSFGDFEGRRFADLEKRVGFLEEGDLLFEGQSEAFYLDFTGRIALNAVAVPSGYPDTSSFNIRRARLGAVVHFYDKYHFKLEGAFDKGRASLKDAFLEADLHPYFSLRAGHFKVPLGFERIQDSRDVPFVERSLSTINLTSDRDIGIIVHGKVYHDMLGYGFGVFNGDGSDVEGDNNSQKEIFFRSDLQPFALIQNPYLKKLRIGGGLALGLDDEDPMYGGSFETRSGLEFITINPNARYEGLHWRTSLEVSHLAGPVSLMYEYISSFQTKVVLGVAAPVLSHNYIVEGHTGTIAYNITGENATFNRLIPKNAFSPTNGKWGAVQLAVRISALDIDDIFLETGTDEGFLLTGANRSLELDLAINWFFNDHMALKLDYSQSWLNRAVDYKGREIDFEKAFTAQLSLTW